MAGTSWGRGGAAFHAESNLQAKWRGLGLCAVVVVVVVVVVGVVGVVGVVVVVVVVVAAAAAVVAAAAAEIVGEFIPFASFSRCLL